MSRTTHRAIAALLVASYGLSVTVSGAFHTHFQADCRSCDSDFRHEPPSCGHDHEGAHVHDGTPSSCEQPGDSNSSAVHSEPDHCAVCSFLAHKPIQSNSSIEIDCVYLAQVRTCLKAVPRIEEPLSPIWSRGPPKVS